MRILYINPGRLEQGLDAVIKGPPLALLSISAMIPEHEAILFDFKVDKYEEVKFRELLRSCPIVAITSMTPQISHALEVAKIAKEEGCITIIGGYHPTLEPNYVISDPNIDYAVRGEGEHTFRELVDYIVGGIEGKNTKKLSEITGITYRDAQQNIIHNAPRQLESDLDKFPIPRFDLLKGKKYSYMGTKTMLIETSRGCPHQCSFCCIIKMWDDQTHKMRYRSKSVERIMEEVYQVDFNNTDFIFFCEDNFTIDVKRTSKILDAIIKSGVNKKVCFSAQSRVDTLVRNPALIDKLERASFRQLFLGIESVHQKSLDAMNKKTNPDMVRQSIKMLYDHGISVFGGMIIGFPGETKQDVRDNIEYAKSLNLDCVQFTPITAFPGTQFFKEMKRDGMVSTLDWKYYNLFTPMMRTPQLTRNELYKLVAEAYSKFYMDTTWLKNKAKQYLFNKKFSWFKGNLYGFAKQFIFGGWDMFRSQGISMKTGKDGYEEERIEKMLAKENKKKIKQAISEQEICIPSELIETINH